MNFKDVSVMILAAGYGKRLRPITDKIPKPLVEVNGIPLIKNIIDLLLDAGFNNIVLNTHYKHEMIKIFLNKNYNKQKNILLSYEKELLDTAGGVKNALPLFKKKIALIINSDIFWTKENFNEIKKLIRNFKIQQKCKLILVPKNKAHGIYKKNADFVVVKGIVERYKSNYRSFFYSGVQIISLELLNRYNMKNISFNLVWDKQIQNKLIYADILNSHWFHIGDINGLKEAENFIT